MTNKLYKEIRKNISLILMVFMILLVFIEFPYYINAPGGIVNLDKKIIIEDEYKSKGSFNIAYVSEYKANIYTLLYAYLNPNFDIIKKSEYLATNDTYESMSYRENLELDESIDSSIIYAYNYANMPAEILKTDIYVTYIYSEANTDIKVGDKIISIDDKTVTDRSSLKSIIDGYDVGDKLNVKVINDNKEYERYAYVIEVEGYKLIGIYTTLDMEYKVPKDIKVKFNKNESGPSGGLMLTLEIYNSLISEDITKGKKIVGTGTINIDGAVGPIAGVEYKLKGAVKRHADIFFVPVDNYEEAINLKNKKGYKIDIVSVSNFNDAIEYLNNL
nr:PDZ domain-containing protein [Bacilli bacterium]